MLELLKIQNVALAKDLSVEFGSGLNVLIGETGAGKSIIFDALNFVLGGKFEKELVRSKTDFIKVDALFSGLSQPVISALSELGIECEGELTLSRYANLDGKNKIFISGAPATAQVLKKVGALLVDSYSQHESVDLLKSKNHLAMLDKFGGRELGDLKMEVAERYARVKDTIKKIEELGGDSFERERTISLLEYQIDEIEKAALKPGELAEIDERLTLLAESEKIIDAAQTSISLLEKSSSSALDNIGQSVSALNGLSNFDDINSCRERLQSTQYEVADIVDTLKDIAERVSFSSGELNALDDRKDEIKRLCRKYGGSEEKVLEYYDETSKRLDLLRDAEGELEKLDKLLSVQRHSLEDVCNSLTAKRREVASLIERKVATELSELGMKNAQFVVNFSKFNEPTANGIDDVEFAFSANVGQEIKALAKTASGGELSRFMLAIKNIFAESGSASTLVFDEIDSGISGETGKVVGEKLKKITSFAQVLCITHLPQVASFGDNFLYVSKSVENGETLSKVENLAGENIALAIAKMIGGNDVTEVALAHAKEMRLMAKK